MRGGTANCTVVISDDPIGSPVRNRFTCLMAMNQASLDKFGDRVKPGGVIAYNQTLVETVPAAGEDVAQIAIPANRIATEMDTPQIANMVAMGGIVRMLKRVSLDSLKRGLVRVLPEYRHHLIPLNEQAIQRGFNAVDVSEA
jgi:2-oxoglutarate ferredoxin oxidoreductase subunit gamma